ncbi:MFS transporter [Sphingomonas sp. dw_22]|uniref:MFS transporter n=1 Tax=Sphingomonas sp. dw_22 TaxID=2721175 RepID=UPI001BD67F9F|nr:MFS transporter [Sphingomonas sp. dw_22]
MNDLSNHAHPMANSAPKLTGGWAAVGSVAAGTFLLVTAEFLPIGLLSRLAHDLHVSEGTAGLAVTAAGFVAAFAGPGLVLLAGRIDRRKIVVGLTAAIIVSNLIAVVAPTFPLFLLGRLLLGFAVGGLWSFAGAVVRRLVADDAGGRATSFISAGIGAGTVWGMPAGALIGGWFGWRAAFAVNVALGVVILFAQLRLLPRLAVASKIDASHLVAFARVPMARAGLIAAGFVAGGHFVAYTYLEPWLRGALRLEQAGVAWTLCAYAVAGVVGTFLGERLAARDVRHAFIMIALVLGGSVLAAAAASISLPTAITLVLIWGIAFGAMPVCVQIWMFNSSPRLYEAGSALMVSAFQIPLAAGAAIGGAIVDRAGLDAAFATGGAITLIGAAILIVFRRASADADHRCLADATS